MKTQNVHCTLWHNTIVNVLQCVTPLMPLCALWYSDVWYGKNIRIICTASESIFDESKIVKIEINFCKTKQQKKLLASYVVNHTIVLPQKMSCQKYFQIF